MNCPLCNCEMEEGGIITSGVSAMWVPMEQFSKKGIRRLIYTNGRVIGKSNVVFGQTKISNAFFCEHCNKIVGIFDVNK
ncbi:hypothetical protein OXPF_37510 [Oxobacter pfennigii]|uniref:DUF6487 domain-containing protein n=1 Tax=Oxobacter pfennigii TaxID=36849 RepID=A0A0P8W533_9CLOT|nr:PF20097 family protein [Oxobacter pfennigii]KPU42697.1 hypothetical protein OXPF_37510 [Oxobacter pfennigii]